MNGFRAGMEELRDVLPVLLSGRLPKSVRVLAQLVEGRRHAFDLVLAARGGERETHPEVTQQLVHTENLFFQPGYYSSW